MCIHVHATTHNVEATGQVVGDGFSFPDVNRKD